jgi:hypothetical protein
MMTETFKCIPGLSREKPKTKSGLVRCLWPEIREALDAGYTIKEICLALNREGISIHYSRLRSLVARLRKMDMAEGNRTDSLSAGAQTSSGSIAVDASAALRAQRAKKIKFDHDPFSTRIKDLV